MNKKESATKGFAILSAAGMLNKILSVLYVPILIRIVGDLGYGVYSAGYRVYTFIYIVTNSGFPIGISKLQAELLAHENYRDSKRSFRIIKLMMAAYGLVMAVLTALLAKQITGALHYEKSYLVILALSPTMLFSALSCSYRGFFNGHSDMKPTAMSQIIEQFLNVTLSLVFAVALMPKGIEWACAGATVGTTIGSLGSTLYLRATFNKKRRMLDGRTPGDVKPLSNSIIIKRLLSYVIPIAFNSIVVFGGDLIDLWNTQSRLLSAKFTSDVATIKFGILSKYSTLLNVPLAITTAMYVAAMPFFSKSIALKDYKQLKDHISDAYRTSLMISIPAAVGLAVLSKPIFLLLFSQRYLDGWNLMIIGSIVVVFASIVQIQGGMLQAANKTRLSTISLIVGLAVKTVINYILIAIPSLNIIGAVIGTIVFYVVAIYMNSRYIAKYVPVRVSIKKHMGRPIAASAAMAIAGSITYKLLFAVFHMAASTYISNALSTVAAILVSILTYGLIMLTIGGITEDDLNMLPYSRRIKKFIPSRILEKAQTK
jgi:Membrane protein involved in the export of O-antigen and teichoic acid